MAETKVYTFDHKEVATALIKYQDIHEGLWHIYIEFGIQGANIATGSDGQTLIPAAIIPITKIGIQRSAKETSLTVDASAVNPQKTAPSGAGQRKLRRIPVE
jgi:hypothetical protein